MGMLAGPFVGAAALLAIAGGFKLVRPGPAARAMRAAGLRIGAPLARGLGAVELFAGLGALLIGTNVFAWLVATCYAAFAAFVALTMLRGEAAAGCGCFGAGEAPPGPVHLALDLAAAGVAAAVALGPGGSLLEVLRRQPLAGVPFLVLAAAFTGLAYAVVSVLPRTLAVMKP